MSFAPLPPLQISTSTSTTPSVPLSYPFLTPLSSPTPSTSPPNLVYRATQVGDLRLFLETVRANPSLIPRVTKIYLSEAFDNMWDSGVIEFVDEYDVAVDTSGQDDEGEEYEPESVETEDEEEGDEDEEESELLPTPTASQILAGDYPPIPPTPRLPVLPLGDNIPPTYPVAPTSNLSFSPATHMAYPSAPAAASSAPGPAAVQSNLDPFKTAVENFALAKTFAGVTDNDSITHEMYIQLVSELLGVFTEREGVFGPLGWEVY